MSIVGQDADPAELTVKGRTIKLPFRDEVRALTPREYAELKASIAAENAVHVPVIVSREFNLIDGHHRIRAALELACGDGTSDGQPQTDPLESIVFKFVPDVDENGQRTLANDVNDYRRQLTPQEIKERSERRRQLREARGRRFFEMRQSGATLQDIADAEHVDVATVHRALAAFAESDSAKADPPAVIVGRDGKAYPTTYKKRSAVLAKSAGEASAAVGLFAQAHQVPQGVASVTDLARTVKEEKREEKREENRALVAGVARPTSATGRYSTIVLDPPWDWGDEGDQDQFGRARPTYATMTIEELHDLDVADLAEPDAHLYLWITNRSLPKGFGLLEAWGFRYVTALTWCKPSIGMGNYFRNNTEHVLFGVRGSLPLLRSDVPTHFMAPRPGQHSAKPAYFFELVESCSPGPWLEMFARQDRPGWASWGEVAA